VVSPLLALYEPAADILSVPSAAGHAAQNVRQDVQRTEKGDSGAQYEWVRGLTKFW